MRVAYNDTGGGRETIITFEMALYSSGHPTTFTTHYRDQLLCTIVESVYESINLVMSGDRSEELTQGRLITTVTYGYSFSMNLQLLIVLIMTVLVKNPLEQSVCRKSWT